MTEKLKNFIARHVFHPLQGMNLGDWWALLRRHRFAIDLNHLPRALVQTGVSTSNSVNARIELRRFGRRIEAARVEAPLFILGHYRSGTTHLHNLLALDPQFAAPTFYQVFNPHTFLSTEHWTAPVVDRLVVRRRYQDEMALGVGMPSEDEFATCTMTGLSPYMVWCFPGDGADYDRYLTFREVQESEVGRWRQALTTFLKKLTPTGLIGSIYESLGLTGFDDLLPRLEGYLASIAGYRKNRLDGLPELLRHRISHEWCRSFDEWGYGR